MWNTTKRAFVGRRRGKPVDGQPGIFRENTIGRLYTVHPNLDECFFFFPPLAVGKCAWSYIFPAIDNC